MKYLIGVVGENGSGKGTFSKVFKEVVKDKKVVIIKFSDILFKTLKLWNLPATRANLQNLPIIMVRQFGEGVLTRAVSEYIKRQKADIVIVEGARWESDLPMIRSFKNNYLVYVTANAKIRYQRMKMRGEKIGEDTKSYSDFLKEEKAITEVNIAKIGKSADIKIVNNGELKDLKKEVLRFYNYNFTR